MMTGERADGLNIPPADYFYSIVQQVLQHNESNTASHVAFPHQNLEKCKRANSLINLQRYSEIKNLQQWFKDAGFTPQLGYNLGTSDISITFSLPSATIANKVFSTDSNVINEQLTKALVIWLMLGIFPHQEEIETLAKPTKTQKITTNWNKQAKVANELLKMFHKQSGIKISERKIDLQRKTIRLEIASDSDYDKTPYFYCQTYSKLGGYLAESFEFSEQTKEEQTKKVFQNIIEQFWDHAENKQHYVPVESLRISLSNSLDKYLRHGWQAQKAEFLPHSKHVPLQFYLCGTAGIGKSAFVSSFAKTLQYVLRANVEPLKRVEIVKLPLNAINCSSLRMILRVKGISDMSIERIIEQTLCKGDVVVFHLEENPEDPFLQLKLFEQTQSMLDKLVVRYPEYRGNIVTIITSNYPPVDPIAQQCVILPMVAVCPDQQVKWCLLKLHDALRKSLATVKGAPQSVSVELNVQPPATDDLRPLEQWWRSISFQLVQHIIHSMRAHKLTWTKTDEPVTVLIDGEPGAYFVSYSHPELSGFFLNSSNGFFYFPPAIQSDEDEAEKKLEQEHGLVLKLDPIIKTIIDMVYNNFLKPGVLILTGSSQERKRWVAVVMEYLYAQYRGDIIRSAKLDLFCEDDKIKVYGSPREIMGGLFRFIDKVNNPNACEGRTDLFGIIIADVNEIGQFILRELLEPYQSKTHRQAVSKDRILFIVSVDKDCYLTPQLLSRTHFVIDCDN